MFTTAERCHNGVDLYARSRNNPWKPQGGTCPNPAVTLPYPSLSDPKSNILINNEGRACLADFGLLTITSDEPTMTSTVLESSVVQWMGPELLIPERFNLKDCRPTKQSDCYALGMTIYEVLSGQAPFSQHSIFAVPHRVMEGDRPTRPEGEQKTQFTDRVWEMLELCWKPQPGDRPNAEAILLDLGGNPYSLRPLSNVGGDVETDSDG